MQTIKIQNCTEYRDSMLKVFVNDEKHVASYHFNKIQVDNDQPFTIRTKYIWGGSPKYTFEPKDNMTLQILHNPRMSNWSGALLIIAMTLNIVQMLFLEKGKGFVLFICFLFLIVPVIISRKRNFTIKEVNFNET